jgi:orotidine-5'-phosphate decarboxylase
MNGTIGLLINSSRGIIYASNGIDFAEKSKSRSLENATRNGSDY